MVVIRFIGLLSFVLGFLRRVLLFSIIRQREYNAQPCSYQTERRTRGLKETGKHMHQKLLYRQVKLSKA